MSQGVTITFDCISTYTNIGNKISADLITPNHSLTTNNKQSTISAPTDIEGVQRELTQPIVWYDIGTKLLLRIHILNEAARA
jgi:hypothetical protein